MLVPVSDSINTLMLVHLLGAIFAKPLCAPHFYFLLRLITDTVIFFDVIFSMNDDNLECTCTHIKALNSL